MESFFLISSLFLPAHARFALVGSGEDKRNVWAEIYHETKEKADDSIKKDHTVQKD